IGVADIEEDPLPQVLAHRLLQLQRLVRLPLIRLSGRRDQPAAARKPLVAYSRTGPQALATKERHQLAAKEVGVIDAGQMVSRSHADERGSGTRVPVLSQELALCTDEPVGAIGPREQRLRDPPELARAAPVLREPHRNADIVEVA